MGALGTGRQSLRATQGGTKLGTVAAVLGPWGFLSGVLSSLPSSRGAPGSSVVLVSNPN